MMPTAASFDGFAPPRKALPPWVTNRLWSPRKNLWKTTMAIPNSSSGAPMPAAVP